MTDKIPVGISNRHLHVSARDRDLLFGRGSSLTKMRDLSQTGQYAAVETVTLIGPKGSIENVRVLGPERKETQVELAITDLRTLGLTAPVRESGDISGTPGIVIIGPKGLIQIKQGLICALRHIHMTPADASRMGVRDRQSVAVRTTGERSVILEKVLVRVDASFRLELHLDTDEANCAGLQNGDTVEMVKSFR